MKYLYFPVGTSNFEKIRSQGYYYVDKTGMIKEILTERTPMVMLITRPRRFGKTLGMSMLEAFFDIRKDHRALFEGLEIASYPALCAAWMNRYPTVFITLRQVDGLNFQDAYGQLLYEIALLYQEHAYVLHARLGEYFGFLQEEVDHILEDANVSDRADRVKRWYDGYHFGDSDVYCPWDVMNYMLELQRDPQAEPVSYWKNTSDNAIIRSFIDVAGSDITQKLETLMAGGVIVQRVDENLTYDLIHSSEDNLWSLLYLSGYLTVARAEDIEGEVPKGCIALMIPNAEICDIFETTVMRWFDDSAKTWNRTALFDAVWQGDSATITKEMNALLRRTISYHDYREDFYHAFLAGIFTGAGYMVDSNKEHGEGRSDVVVHDGIHARVAIFEAKYTKSLGQLERACDVALQQIDERMYAKEYEDDYDEILCYGISFFKKRCMVKKK
ncbi:AAA family ATPase [Oribacterium sp. P9]|uniref:AAA family ATPase n=1 Tax=Oribacterium sp. P9 TaxID=3378068 RepID=UPI003967217A